MDRFHVRILPWVVAGAALVFYLITLNRWVSFNSLATIAKITGWDWWSLSLQAPLFYVLTLPARALPHAWQPFALNLFSAVCGAGALGLLARSVALLPQDRTRDQRQREGGDHGLLSMPASWLPPIFAALVCGLQLSFWEHATSATGEMLDLLLFSFAVWSLLEYRIDGRAARLYALAFVYGMSVTNNWAMIGFFPGFLVALIWIQGIRFLNWRFLARMLLAGLLGLTLYFLLPLIEKSGNGADMTFWELFRGQLAMQKRMLTSVPKYILMLCGLSSALPVFLMGFRFPSSFGDTSVVGSFLTHYMYRFIHLLLLGFCLYVSFDSPASPRQLGMGLAFLPAYYLGALAIGYFSGYFLLVCGVKPQARFHRESPGARLANQAMVAVIYAAAVGVPIALAVHSYPRIRTNNSQHLADYATHLVEKLPAQGAILMSDEPWQLMLVEAISARRGVAQDNVLVDTRASALPYHVYQHNLARHYPGRWPDLLKQYSLPEPIDHATLLRVIMGMARTNQIYYLNPAFNYYGEVFSFEPQGLAYALRPLPPFSVTNPAPTADAVRENLAFWSGIKTEFASAPPKAQAGVKDINRGDTDYLRTYYTRAVNRFGVELQRHGLLEPAKQCFDLALEFDPENEVADINRRFNENLRAGKTKAVELEPAAEAKLRARYPRASDRLRSLGPFDEPRFTFEQGESFAGYVPPLIRQAAQQFARVRELDPANLEAGIWLANMYLKWPSPSRVLEVVSQMEPAGGQPALLLNFQIELVRLKALALAMTNNHVKAIEVLREAQAKNPGVAELLDTLAQVYLGQGDATNALAALEQELQLEGNRTATLVKAGTLQMRLGRYAEAAARFGRALELDPKEDSARLFRALSYLQLGQLDEAEKDFKLALEVVGSVREYRVFRGLGEIAWQRKDNAKALEYYSKYRDTLPVDKQGKPIFAEDIPQQKVALERLQLLGAPK